MKKISFLKPLLVSAMLLLAVTSKAQSHGNRMVCSMREALM